MNARNVPLAEARAEARALEDQMKRHRQECVKCGSGKGRIRCEAYKEMAASLSALKRQIKDWFAPGKDQADLFSDL